MKNLLRSAFALLLVTTLFTTTAAGSKPQKEIVKHEFSANIDCAGCVKKVMNTLPYQKGIKDVDVNLSAKQITVTYDTSKSSDKDIITALSKVNINASLKQGSAECSNTGCCSTDKR